MQYQKTVAVIGGGYWGKNLIRNMYELGALHTICDVNESLLDQHAARYEGVRVTTNSKSVMDDPKITHIVIATPAPTHFALAEQALKAEKHVYVEKPMVLDINEGEALVALAKDKDKTLMVGHILQFHPCVIKMQEMVQSGQLGRVQHITSNRLNLGKIQTKESALWALAPHDISVILSLCGGQLPEQVRCHGGDYLSDGVADVTLTTMRFADRVQAHIYVSWLNPLKEQKLVIVGSSGMLVFDDTKEWEEKLTLFKDPVKWLDGQTPQENRREGERVCVEYAEPLKQECRHFLDCSLKGVQPKTSGAEGLRVLRVLQAAEQSLREEGGVREPAKLQQPVQPLGVQAHATCCIDAGAVVGVGTKVWHFSHVMKGAKVGPSCNIGQNVVISPGVTLGRNVKVQNNVSIYSGVVCEDDVFLGPSMVFTNIPNPRSEVVRRDEYKETLVKKGATIGANATILCGVTLGQHSFVGAGSVVTKDVKPYALVVGNPARRVGWMSRHGEKLSLAVSLPEGESKRVRCPATGEEYELVGDTLSVVEPSSRVSMKRMAGVASGK